MEYQQVRSVIAVLTIVVVLGMVVADPLTGDALISHRRLTALLAFVAVMLGADIIRE